MLNCYFQPPGLTFAVDSRFMAARASRLSTKSMGFQHATIICSPQVRAPRASEMSKWRARVKTYDRRQA
jgi:hypothetical protein